MLEKTERVMRNFINGVSLLSAVVMILLMFYVAVDAIMRNLNRSFVGSNEFVVNVIVIVVFLGLGGTSVKNAQIKIDVFAFLPRMDHVTLLLTTLIYIISGIAAFNQASLAKTMGLSSTFLSIPRWPFLVISGIGLILCGLGALCVELRFISARRAARTEKYSGIREVEV
jgi:TRAP-type C4-dicarboxylate transport system permease small subunit